jgi:hypothetical protein
VSDEWIGEAYYVGFWITWVLTFLIVWIGCSLGYGFLGFALGWMPAIIVAYIAAFIWPLLLFGVALVAFKIWG